jgi:hypothetical protein
LSLKAFTGIHLGAIVTTFWFLLFNSFVGYQVLDDGTPTSISFLAVPGLALFIGTAYIALDTGYGWTGHFDSRIGGQNRNIGLYVLYQLVPLVFVVAFFFSETIIVLRVLQARKPMSIYNSTDLLVLYPLLTSSVIPVYLGGSAISFAVGQIFQHVVSTHICNATEGKINGAPFETLFTLPSVVMLWVFWASNYH